MGFHNRRFCEWEGRSNRVASAWPCRDTLSKIFESQVFWGIYLRGSL
jgi:hypothetical protein